MAQSGSRGVYQAGQLLLKNGMMIIPLTAAPVNGTSGTGAGKAAPGSIAVNTTNGFTWQNTGTKASPTWRFFGPNGVQNVPILLSIDGAIDPNTPADYII